jgi:hypothetical protein
MARDHLPHTNRDRRWHRPGGRSPAGESNWPVIPSTIPRFYKRKMMRTVVRAWRMHTHRRLWRWVPWRRRGAAPWRMWCSGEQLYGVQSPQSHEEAPDPSGIRRRGSSIANRGWNSDRTVNPQWRRRLSLSLFRSAISLCYGGGHEGREERGNRRALGRDSL